MGPLPLQWQRPCSLALKFIARQPGKVQVKPMASAIRRCSKACFFRAAE